MCISVSQVSYDHAFVLSKTTDESLSSIGQRPNSLAGYSEVLITWFLLIFQVHLRSLLKPSSPYNPTKTHHAFRRLPPFPTKFSTYLLTLDLMASSFLASLDLQACFITLQENYLFLYLCPLSTLYVPPLQ